MKPVVGELVRARGILVQKLAESFRPAESGRLEDVERRVRREELIDSVSIARVESLQQVRHQRSNRDSRRSFRTRPPV